MRHAGLAVALRYKLKGEAEQGEGPGPGGAGAEAAGGEAERIAPHSKILEFTPQEWAALGVTDLRADDYVKIAGSGPLAVDVYLRPVRVEKEVLVRRVEWRRRTGGGVWGRRRRGV